MVGNGCSHSCFCCLTDARIAGIGFIVAAFSINGVGPTEVFCFRIDAPNRDLIYALRFDFRCPFLILRLSGAIRGRFFKDAACTALCCVCIPLEILADSARTPTHSKEERKKAKMTGTGKEHLADACGTYCGACPAYIAKHSEDEQIKMKLQMRLSSGPRFSSVSLV
jgi:hypothetical protein